MKINNKFSIKTIVAIGIGAAVFMILGRFGSIPTGIPNTNIETAYALFSINGCNIWTSSRIFNRTYRTWI